VALKQKQRIKRRREHNQKKMTFNLTKEQTIKNERPQVGIIIPYEYDEGVGSIHLIYIIINER
jgi:hypothetical protein